MAGLAVYAVAFVVYALTASTAIGWLDASELVAASSSLGVAHSPGHPAVVMLGKLGTFIPIGDIAFRVALISAAVGAGAATATFYLARALFSAALPSNPRSSIAMAAASAWVVAFAWAAWIQSVRAEVYALEALLLVATLAAALAYHRAGHARYLLTASLLAGLAISNHHAIAATVLIPAAVVILIGRRPPARVYALGAGCGLVGLATWAYLPVRAATDPALNWGAPSTIGRFFWTISGQAFHKTAGAEHVSTRGEDAAQALVAIGGGATVPLLLIGLLAIYIAARQREHLVAVAALVGVVGLGIILRTMLGFDPETPDHHGYLWPAIVAMVLLGGLGVAQLASLVERHGSRGPAALAPQIAVIAITALAGVQLVANASRSNLATASASDTLATLNLETQPPRALLLTAYFETRFQLAAAREVFGARPDVTVLDRSFLTYPGAAASRARRHPELAALIAAPLRAGEPSPLAQLDATAHTREIRVELHPNVDAPLRARLVPRGSFAIYAAADEVAALRASAESADHALMTSLSAKLDEAAADSALLWREFLRLELYCERGQARAAAATQARIIARTPEARSDRSLVELAARCGLEVP